MYSRGQGRSDPSCAISAWCSPHWRLSCSSSQSFCGLSSSAAATARNQVHHCSISFLFMLSFVWMSCVWQRLNKRIYDDDDDDEEPTKTTATHQQTNTPDGTTDRTFDPWPVNERSENQSHCNEFQVAFMMPNSHCLTRHDSFLTLGWVVWTGYKSLIYDDKNPVHKNRR